MTMHKHMHKCTHTDIRTHTHIPLRHNIQLKMNIFNNLYYEIPD